MNNDEYESPYNQGLNDGSWGRKQACINPVYLKGYTDARINTKHVVRLGRHRKKQRK